MSSTTHSRRWRTGRHSLSLHIGPQTARQAAPCARLTLRSLQADVEIYASSAPCTIAALAPAAMALADLNSARTSQEASVTCRAGCDACCYYLVPLTLPEAMLIEAQLAALPAALARTLWDRIERSADRLLAAGRPPARADELSNWYRDIDLPCPLLYQRRCSQYAMRPIACREHLWTGPADSCHGESRESPAATPMSMLDVLASTVARVTGQGVQTTMLPLSLRFGRLNAGQAAQTHDAAMLADALAAQLLEHDRRASRAGVSPARELTIDD